MLVPVCIPYGLGAGACGVGNVSIGTIAVEDGYP